MLPRPSTLRSTLTAAAGGVVALSSFALLSRVLAFVPALVLSAATPAVLAAVMSGIARLGRRSAAPVPAEPERAILMPPAPPGEPRPPYQSAAKAEYLAGISHEIRTPLNGILGLTQLLLKMRPTAQQREYLEMIRSSGDSLLRLINDILDHARIRSGQLGFVAEPFLLRKVVRETAKSLAPQAHLKELELAYWVEPDVPDALVGDPSRLRQVLTNLLSNAIKFTDEGEIYLEVRREGESPGGNETTIGFSVTDTGIGVPVANRERIFESFAQGNGDGRRKYGGVGLGLTISSQLVEKMGGRITLESDEGKGSRFRFDAHFEKSESRRETHSLESIQGLRILIVDDSELYRSVLLRLMAHWGLEAVAAGSITETRARLEDAERGPGFSLFLLDSHMSGGDAWAIAREIQTRARIPGVLITQSHERVDTARLRKHGFLGYLSKPVAPSHLLRAIEIIRRGATIEGPEDVQTNTMDRLALGGLRVLLAEDNPVNQTVAVRMLEKAGSEVVVVDDGRAALDAWSRGRFDILLLDVEMPELSGIEVATAVRVREREEENGGHVPILALTAHARPEDRERCLSAGMDEFVTKPFQEEDLVAVMERLLSRRESLSRRSDARAAFPPNFDRRAALRRANGDPALLAELSELFLEETPKTMEAIRIAVSAGDARTVEKLAHRLKGSLLTLSAARAGEIARRLETQASGGALVECGETLFELGTEIERLNRDLLAHAANVS